MSPMTTITEKAYLGQEFGDVAPTVPATHYCGLLVAATRASSTPYSVGQYIANPTFPFFNPTVSSVWSIFKCTVAGTTAASAPGGFASSGGAGGTITDGGVTWTEVSNLFAGQNFTGAEPSGGSYARPSISNNNTSWPVPTGGNPAQVQNGQTITFPQVTAPWGQIAGWAMFDAVTAGNARWWGLLNALSEVATVTSVTPDFAVDALTLTLV